MSKKILTIILFFLFLGLVGGWGYFKLKAISPDFEDLSAEEMYGQIIKERDWAIQKAVEAGDYRCCIEPPCTMCYMEANKWNNHQAGTCACDDLIAKGQEPCPQCLSGLCSGAGNCQIKEN